MKIKRTAANYRNIREKIKKRKKKEKERKLKRHGYVLNDQNCNYVSGTFYSEKNDKAFPFRSTYEFAYLFMLENDDNVDSYIVEPFYVKYKHPRTGEIKRYYPDILILYTDGSMYLVEIKPVSLLCDPVVKRKASAARKYLKTHMPDVKFKFVTEEDIFESAKDYSDLKKLLSESLLKIK